MHCTPEGNWYKTKFCEKVIKRYKNSSPSFQLTKGRTHTFMLILLVTLTVFITSGLIFLVKLGTSRK